MSTAAIRSILHPTDLSPFSLVAFAHALRIALATRSRLCILHVLQDNVGEGWESPDVRLRRLLVRWGFLEKTDPLWAAETKLGLEIEKFAFDHSQTPAKEILHFLNQHACDLIVLATHGRDGIERWLKGSVAESVSRQSAIPTLFVPHSARGFVNHVNGEITLRHVLVPVDHNPIPYRAVEAARIFPHLLTGVDIQINLLHIGGRAPEFHDAKNRVVLRHGNVVQTILDAAFEYDADFICMATAGHHGVLDALRGSTTERVLRHALCPLLAISAK